MKAFTSKTKQLKEQIITSHLDETYFQIAIPKALGGDDEGASPLEIMSLAVASCVHIMVLNQLDYGHEEGMTVTAQGYKSRVKKGQTPWLETWSIYVRLPTVPEVTEEIEDVVLRGMSECPMDQLLHRAGANITLFINGQLVER